MARDELLQDVYLEPVLERTNEAGFMYLRAIETKAGL